MNPDAEYLLPPPAHQAVAELEIKRSRFISHIARVQSEDEARQFVTSIKQRYPDARHHCSAYFYNVEGANPVERSSDDGEPSGTAGKPILDVLTGSGLEDIACVVVRYFGGIKLGTGGLVRAYSDATAAALTHVVPVRRSLRRLATMHFPHADAGKYEADLRARGYVVTDVAYGTDVVLTVAIKPSEEEALGAYALALTRGAVVPEFYSTMWVELPA
ncbi:IMPACT family protein [Corynebacterium pyruviciproducens]